jgi:6-phosphofructokinase
VRAILVRLLLVQLPGRSCSYLVARAAAKHAAAAIRAAEPSCAARFKRKRAAAREAASRAAYLVVRATAYREAADHAAAAVRAC